MSSVAKWIAFAFGVGVLAVGIAGLLSPALLVGIAGWFGTASAWLALAVVRTAVGLVLITAAPASRFPRGLRWLGIVIVVLAIVTLGTGLAGVAPASAAIDRWLAMGTTVARLTALPILALGGFVTYAVWPRRG